MKEIYGIRDMFKKIRIKIFSNFYMCTKFLKCKFFYLVMVSSVVKHFTWL